MLLLHRKWTTLLLLIITPIGFSTKFCTGVARRKAIIAGEGSGLWAYFRVFVFMGSLRS